MHCFIVFHCHSWNQVPRSRPERAGGLSAPLKPWFFVGNVPHQWDHGMVVFDIRKMGSFNNNSKISVEIFRWGDDNSWHLKENLGRLQGPMFHSNFLIRNVSPRQSEKLHGSWKRGLFSKWVWVKSLAPGCRFPQSYGDFMYFQNGFDPCHVVIS